MQKMVEQVQAYDDDWKDWKIIMSGEDKEMPVNVVVVVVVVVGGGGGGGGDGGGAVVAVVVSNISF